MNILIVVPWDQEFGGVASVVGNLAKHLQREDHVVRFLHPGTDNFLRSKSTKWGFPGSTLRLRAPFVVQHPIRSVLGFLAYFPITVYQIISLIRRHRIQIINIHYPVDEFIYFAVCRWILPVRLVVSVHGADFFPDGIREPFYSRAMRFLIPSSHGIVAPSAHLLKQFQELFPATQRKGFVIHNGISLAELEAPKENVSGDAGKYILCIAKHERKKGLDVLIHALARLESENVTTKLILVGDGPVRSELENLARSLKVNACIEFLGRQGRSRVKQLLSGCTVLVLPSRAEPFGIAIIEAMACRKPVIATEVGGIPEIIESGKNGLLVKPDNPPMLAEALTRILMNANLRDTLAANGYTTVRDRFCSENTGKAYEQLYYALLGQQQTSTAL